MCISPPPLALWLIVDGEQVLAQSIAQAHHGIVGERFKRLMLEAFGFAGDEFVAAAGTQSGGGVAHFVWVAGNDAAEGGDAGQCDVLLPTPRSSARPAVCLCRGWGIARAVGGFP